MTKTRKTASSFLLQGHEVPPADVRWGQVSDVLDFFQILGTFAKAGHVNTELLYKFFYYWLSNYWKACEGHVKVTQLSSPMTWGDAKWLYESLRAFDQRNNFGLLSDPSSEKMSVFFQWEYENLSA
ncbi:MAG TPA: hypothetical protein VH881_00010 [Burkholderiales bacterium]|jgi:hypothetical protein